MSATFYIFGTTCVGKDHLIELAVEKHPDLFGAVQVGKRFRELYPPEYFEGLGAPEKCEDEAFKIFREQHDAATESKKKWILVSGQPRRPSQVERILGYAPGTIFWLHASNEVVESRIHTRFKDNPQGWKLANERITTDRVMLFDTLFALLQKSIPIIPMDTTINRSEDIIHQILISAPMVCGRWDPHGVYEK